jgi:hypothetical protein
VAVHRIQFTRKEPCSSPGCPNFVWARGLCTRHYQAEYRTRGPPCSSKGCPKTSFAKGLCVRHYQEHYRHRNVPCGKRRCRGVAFSRGLCVKHYHRWYQSLLRAHRVKSLKAVPSQAKERIPGVRAAASAQQRVRRRRKV